MNIQERLKIFYERLKAAPPADSAEKAFALICRTLQEVENELCPLPQQNPPPKTFDGRMYLPQTDNVRMSDDGIIWVRTRKHRIMIKSDGSFAIFHLMPHRTLLREFQKAGTNR